MLKAASLIYAIFISLLMGILCYSLLLVYSLNTNLNDHYDLRNRLLLHNQSGLAFIAANFNNPENLNNNPIDHNDSNIITYIDQSPWGFFKKYTISTISKNDTVHQFLLAANKRFKKTPALYLRDNDEPLKISGKTIIKGDVYISKKGLKKVTISGNNGLEKPLHEGKIYNSNKQLSLPDYLALNYPSNYELLLLEDLKFSSLINLFKNKTKVLEVESRLENIKLKGNIIVTSKDTLTIYKSALLEDIIIEAPKVIFHEGFEGNIQVYASKEVVIKSNVKLLYPSVLFVDSKEDIKKSIVMEEYSSMYGSLVLLGNGLASEDKNRIIIHQNALVYGEVICDGKLSLYGIVKGSVFTSSLLHETNVTEYDNLLFNSQILRNEFSDDFFQIPTLDDFKSEELIFVKKI